MIRLLLSLPLPFVVAPIISPYEQKAQDTIPRGTQVKVMEIITVVMVTMHQMVGRVGDLEVQHRDKG